MYISVFTYLMTTKLDKVMAYCIGQPCTKLHNSLITWLYVVLWQIKNVLTETSLFLTGFRLAWKNPSVKLFFFLRALIFEQQYQFSHEFVCRPDWSIISDSESGEKYIIGTPLKFPIRNFFRDRWSVSTYNKRLGIFTIFS